MFFPLFIVLLLKKTKRHLEPAIFLTKQLHESEEQVTVYNGVHGCVIKQKACQWTSSAFYNSFGLNASSPKLEQEILIRPWTNSEKYTEKYREATTDSEQSAVDSTWLQLYWGIPNPGADLWWRLTRPCPGHKLPLRQPYLLWGVKGEPGIVQEGVNAIKTCSYQMGQVRVPGADLCSSSQRCRGC